VVQAEGLEAVFTIGHSWRVNGEDYLNSYISRVNVSTSIAASVNTSATLTITALGHLNNTVVQCRAFVREELRIVEVLSAINSTLQIQGI